MKKYKIKPNQITYNCLINGCAENDNLEIGKKIHEKNKSHEKQKKTNNFSLFIKNRN